MKKIDPIKLHKKLKGKIEIISRATINSKEDLSAVYTPGVALPCLEIKKDINKIYDYTRKGNLVAIVTDGSAVLGLGDIGPEASLPVMEGKAVLFKEFADIDAFPIALKIRDIDEIVRTVENISPIFGGILLEDICSPRCFEIEEKLQKKLDMPVFHDDQHGTAIVVLAGIYNALRVVEKKLINCKVIVNGAGAAGMAVTKLIIKAGVGELITLDSKGTIYKNRKGLNKYKKAIALVTNKKQIKADLRQAIKGADIFIGVSRPNLVDAKMIKSMNKKSIIFALANPTPEVMPNIAIKAGAAVVATGRSDFPNQINNVLVFPGLFRGLLDNRINFVSDKIKLEVAAVLSNYVKKPTANKIMPDVLDKKIAKIIARTVKKIKYEN